METENEQPEVIEQEEEQIEEQLEETTEEQSEEESDDIVLSKSEFKKLQRKAFAYDATKETKEVKTAKPSTEKTANSDLDLKIEKLELRAEGYSPDEIEAIQELGGAKALKNPVVQSAIKAMRAEKKSQDAKEPLNSKSPVYKKYTQQDLSKLTALEMEKILQE